MSTYGYLFSDRDEPEETPDETVDDAAEEAAQAAASEAALRLDMDEYLDLIAAINSARPLPAQAADTAQLSGAEWIAQGVRETLTPTDPSRFLVTVRVVQDAVVAEVYAPAGMDRQGLGQFLAQRLFDRGNLGVFEVALGADPRTVFLIRRGVTGPGLAWRAHGPRAAKFFEDRDGQRVIFDLCKLRQTHKQTGAKRFPKVHLFDEDDRGGTAELRLPPGMLLDKVKAAEPALRQAFNAPNLTVTARGVYPVIHLNSKLISKEFPKMNPLKASMFVRPRTMAERHAAADDFVIPLGVRADGSPILVKQSVAPHMAIFGGTGMGKTVLLSSIVKAAVLQSAEVILADAKNGRDLRSLALQNLPGVVHYSAGSEAGLHRVVKYCRDEFERRRTLAAALQQRGIIYRPTPLLLVFDEAGAWLDDQIQEGGEARKAAEQTIANFSYIAAQAREQKVFLLTAGQHAYVSAFSGRWKSNTSTVVVLGPPTENHRQALFSAGDQREQVKDLGSQISRSAKGRGLVADTDTGEIVMFQGYFNPPGEAADAFDAEVVQAPKLRRFGWRFPLPNEEGGDGSWQDWTPVSEPSSDDLPVQILDGPDGAPDPGATVFDPTSSEFRPGSKPLSAAHRHATSYDQN